MLQQLFQQPTATLFLQTADKGYNYGWLQQKLKKTLGLFQTLNLTAGDRLLVAVSDDVEMSVLFLSALTAGIVVVIGDPEMKAPRANAIVSRSNPRCIIADKETLERW